MAQALYGIFRNLYGACGVARSCCNSGSKVCQLWATLGHMCPIVFVFVLFRCGVGVGGVGHVRLHGFAMVLSSFQYVAQALWDPFGFHWVHLMGPLGSVGALCGFGCCFFTRQPHWRRNNGNVPLKSSSIGRASSGNGVCPGTPRLSRGIPPPTYAQPPK